MKKIEKIDDTHRWLYTSSLLSGHVKVYYQRKGRFFWTTVGRSTSPLSRIDSTKAFMLRDLEEEESIHKFFKEGKK